MAKPRVFISSTYYDLKHIRSSLNRFVEAMGFEPVLSEKGDIPYSPDIALDESCYREVLNCDIFVMIIGGRYGSPASGISIDTSKEKLYDSVTKKEMETAVNADIPTYVLVDSGVYSDYENYKRNREVEYDYAHVDSVNILLLIDCILKLPKNNPVFPFVHASDIENWLQAQWVGLFRDLLGKRSSQSRLSSLELQVEQLAEVNQTLRLYLERIISAVSAKDAPGLIQREDDRLATRRQQLVVQHYVMLFDWLDSNFGVNQSAALKVITQSNNLEELIRGFAEASDKVKNESIVEKKIFYGPMIMAMIDGVRENFGLEAIVWVNLFQRFDPIKNR